MSVYRTIGPLVLNVLLSARQERTLLLSKLVFKACKLVHMKCTKKLYYYMRFQLVKEMQIGIAMEFFSHCNSKQTSFLDLITPHQKHLQKYAFIPERSIFLNSVSRVYCLSIVVQCKDG